MRLTISILALGTVAGCTAPVEQTPKQQYLNRVAGAEIVLRDCPAVGGYGAFSAMREDAMKNHELAKQLGATEADLAAAKTLVGQQYASAYFLVGPERSCHELIKRLGWAGSTPAMGSKTP